MPTVDEPLKEFDIAGYIHYFILDEYLIVADDPNVSCKCYRYHTSRHCLRTGFPFRATPFAHLALLRLGVDTELCIVYSDRMLEARFMQNAPEIRSTHFQVVWNQSTGFSLLTWPVFSTCVIVLLQVICGMVVLLRALRSPALLSCKAFSIMAVYTCPSGPDIWSF